MTDPGAHAPAEPTWESLAQTVTGCVACPELAATRTQVVPGLDPPGAELMLVGEAPGATEDEAGVPFVGRAGQLLDGLLAEAGIERAGVACVNVLKCRPPRNRTPRRAEVRACRPWLTRQIQLARPLLVVTLGGTAAQWFAGPSARITALRATLLDHAGTPVLCTYHPSAALRFGPAGEPMAALRSDLQRAGALLAELRSP